MEQTIQPVQAQEQKLETPMTDFIAMDAAGTQMLNSIETELNQVVAELF